MELYTYFKITSRFPTYLWSGNINVELQFVSRHVMLGGIQFGSFVSFFPQLPTFAVAYLTQAPNPNHPARRRPFREEKSYLFYEFR